MLKEVHKEKPNFSWARPQDEAGDQCRPPTSSGRPRPSQTRGLPSLPLSGRPPPAPTSPQPGQPPRQPWLPKRLHSLAKIRPMPASASHRAPRAQAGDSGGSATRSGWTRPAAAREQPPGRAKGGAGFWGGPAPSNGRTARGATPTRRSRRAPACVIAYAHGA